MVKHDLRSNNDIEDRTDKKSLVMIMGNTKDLDGLLQLLENETDPEIINQIVIVLGALGRSEAIEPLTSILHTVDDKILQKRIKEAIELIQTMCSY